MPQFDSAQVYLTAWRKLIVKRTGVKHLMGMVSDESAQYVCLLLQLEQRHQWPCHGRVHTMTKHGGVIASSCLVWSDDGASLCVQMRIAVSRQTAKRERREWHKRMK